MKKLFTFMLFLCAALTASADVTVYVKSSLSTLYLHAWGTGGDQATWPGTPMTVKYDAQGQTWHVGTIGSAYSDGFIINQGADQPKTGDLAVPANDAAYDFTSEFPQNWTDLSTKATEIPTLYDTDPTATTTTVGAEDNSANWWTAFSEYYTIEPGKTLSLHFTNYSSKEANAHNWLAVVTTDAERGATGYSEHFVLRADNYAWQYGLNTGAESSHDWYQSLVSNYNWDTFKDDMDGADVKMKIIRIGSTVTLHAIMTTTSGKKYFEVFKMDCGNSDSNIRVFLTTEKGHLVINDNDTDTTDSGKLVGSADNTAAYLGATSETLQLSDGMMATYEFTNYTPQADVWNSYLACVGQASTDKIDDIIVLRNDNYELVQGSNEGVSNNFNWGEESATYKADMNGAKGVATFRYVNGSVKVHIDLTTTNGDVFYEEFTKTGVTGEIKVAMSVDHSHMYIHNAKSEVIWTVSGTMNDWNATADRMTETAPGSRVYTKTYTGLAAGHHEFKVKDFSTWDIAYPASNYEFDLAEASDVTINYFVEDNSVTLKIGDKWVGVWTVAGTAVNGDVAWDFASEANKMTSEDGRIWKLAVNSKYLEAGTTYEWKVGKDNATEETYGQWEDGKWVDDKWEEGKWVNKTFSVEKSGYYNIVYNFNAANGGCWENPTEVASAVEIAVPEAISGTKYLTFGNVTYPVSFAAFDDITIYTAKYDNAEGVIKLATVAVKEVPANTGVILFKEAGFTEALTLPVLGEAAALGDNDLKVSDGNVQGAEDIFCLSNGDDGLGFYPVDSSIKVPANKAYLDLSNLSLAPKFIGFPGETTGIDALENGEATAEKAGAIYTLDGRRVNGNLSQGLYIQNGKKFVVK